MTGSNASTFSAEQIIEAPDLRIPRRYMLVIGLLILGGLAAAGQQLLNGEVKLLWVALQVNFIFWFSLAAASVCFVAVFQITGAQWSKPLERIFAAGFPFLILCPLWLAAMSYGRRELFVWADGRFSGKGWWLRWEIVYLRDTLGLVLLVYASYRLMLYLLKRDYILLKRSGQELRARERCWWDEKIARTTPVDAQEQQKLLGSVQSKSGRWSPAVVLVYTVVLSLIAFDQIMSVDPQWSSSLFGVFYFMTAGYLALAAVSVAAALLKDVHPLYSASLTAEVFHDLGKMLFGFGIFWAYLFWSHYLTIWYGNMPEETGWVITRLREQPWHGAAWMVFGMCFIVPFFAGLSRELKRTPLLLGLVGVIVCFGIWLEYYLLFVPTLYPKVIPLTAADAGIAFGFAGCYALLACWYLRRMPLMPVSIR